MKFTWLRPCLAIPGFPPWFWSESRVQNLDFCGYLHPSVIPDFTDWNLRASVLVMGDEVFGRWVSELLFHRSDPTSGQKQLKGEEASIGFHFPHGREDRAAGRALRRGRAGSVQCFCKVIKHLVPASLLRAISLVSNFPHGFWDPVRS